jgi:hypothetical protein
MPSNTALTNEVLIIHNILLSGSLAFIYARSATSGKGLRIPSEVYPNMKKIISIQWIFLMN